MVDKAVIQEGVLGRRSCLDATFVTGVLDCNQVAFVDCVGIVWGMFSNCRKSCSVTEHFVGFFEHDCVEWLHWQQFMLIYSSAFAIM